MPLTAKGSEVLKSMEKTYGSKEKAEQVLYASKNAGKITGIDSVPAGLESLIDAVCSMCDSINKTTARLDAYVADAAFVKWSVVLEKKEGGERKTVSVRANNEDDARRFAQESLGDQAAGKWKAVKTARADDRRVIGGVQIQPTDEQIKNTLGMRFGA